MSDGVFTEDEVNRMLAEQRVNLRLDSMERIMADLTDKLAALMRKEESGQEQIIAKVAEGMSERRKAEVELHKKIDTRHEEYHKMFVKKADLRLYAALIVFAITATVSVITYINTKQSDANHESSMHEMTEKIESMLGGK